MSNNALVVFLLFHFWNNWNYLNIQFYFRWCLALW